MALGIVDWMKQNGQDSSYANRKKLAEQHGISGYTGTAAQNTQLLNQLQSERNAQSTNQNSVSTNVTAGAESKSTRNPYTPSQTVNDYKGKVQDLEDNYPDEFDSRYDDMIQDILGDIMNRPDFSYTGEDMANDDLYKMYRDQYTRNAERAMRDTIGAASALSGGYGNSYAAAVGQQAYNNQIAALNEKAFDFYDRAYQRYQDAGQELYNQIGLVTGLDDRDYDRYRDEVSDYFANRDYFNNRYNQEYGYDYGRYQDDLAYEQWLEEMQFQKDQAAQAQANWEKEFALQQQAAARSRSSGGSSRSRSKSSSSSGKNALKDPDSARISWTEAANAYMDAYKAEGKEVADNIMNYLESAGAVDMYKEDKENIRTPDLYENAGAIAYNDWLLKNPEGKLEEMAESADAWRKKWKGIK